MGQSNKKKGVIAAGHPETVKAAERILRDGGNAFDAAVAAQLTAFVAEPVLTSLGGGGFLMAETGSGSQTLYDFFVQTPVHKKEPSELSFYPISADFGEAKQEYHIGPGSVAAPGMVKGLFEIHRDLCTLPIKVLAEPAIQLARSGVVMNRFQSGVFDIIRSIYRLSPEAAQIFRSTHAKGDLVREGETLMQPELAEFLEQLVIEGDRFFYEGEIARTVSQISNEKGGHLTEEDFRRYRVKKRKPLKIDFRGQKISINPPPCSGGMLIGFGLKLIEKLMKAPLQFGSAAYIDLLARVQEATDKARLDAFTGSSADESDLNLLNPDDLLRYAAEVRGRLTAFRGTTQISIADSEGNLASMTSSNGEGSGVMIPGTGVMLNNMLGEQDLNPGGFHNWKRNERVTSMMAPGILTMRDNTKVAFGSGGSNRIRTAILQLLINIVDFEMTLDEAVNAPRVHFEEDELNLEGGFDQAEIERVKERYSNHKIWKSRNLYFGGAHAVSSGPGGFTGSGDERRGGVARVVW